MLWLPKKMYTVTNGNVMINGDYCHKWIKRYYPVCKQLCKDGKT